jgi:hypothetical protein
VHGLLGPMICGQTGLNPSTSSRPQCVH